MLAYAPLHYLLLEELSALVMTSGKQSGEPIAFENAGAQRCLQGIAGGVFRGSLPELDRNSGDRKFIFGIHRLIAMVGNGQNCTCRSSRLCASYHPTW
ncbi:MAG: Sua5/YciO/YrdC/YwlC family protein [Desulfuromonadales bacterium]|nr:Sua5/YciO/YrdC/YwlC family protein [Desulfuromonadales bacterium]